jgi:membrane-associated phospholipid phosphatase
MVFPPVSSSRLSVRLPKEEVRDPLYAGARILSLSSWLLALLLLLSLGGTLAPLSAMALAAILGTLWGAHCYYRARKDAQRLAVALGLLAILLASGAAAGAISQLGLAFGMPLVDARLAEADRLLGFSAPAAIAWLIQWPLVPALLGVAYISSFPLLFGTALVLALWGREGDAWNLCFVFAAAIIFSAICAVLYPAEGAFLYYSIRPEITAILPSGSGVYHLSAMQYFRNSSSITLDLMQLQGVVTFPSFHTALALMTAFAWRHYRWIFYPMIAWNSVVIISTIPIGGHYFIDLVGGSLLWGGLAVISWSLARRTNLPAGLYQKSHSVFA